MPGEMRNDPRQKTYLGGRVIQDDGISIACVIRNVSASGALVEIPPLIPPPPDTWTLLDLKNGLAHRVSVSWRRDTRIGVRFEQSFDLSGTVPDEVRPAQRIWGAERQLRGDT